MNYFRFFSFQFDSKTSPLALLAQTCSAIGADASPNPKLLANIEKSTKSLNKPHDNREKMSPGSASTFSNSSASDTPKSSFKPYESSLKERERRSPEEKNLASSNRIKSPKQSIPMLSQPQTQPYNLLTNGRCGSNHSASSPRSSPTQKSTPNTNQDKSVSPNRASSKESSQHNGIANSDSPKTESSKDLNNGAKTSTPSLSSSLQPIVSTSSPFLGYPYPMDYLTTSALMSKHHSMLQAAAMHPYLNYARMKAASNASDAIMGICRDPYCTGCALSSHVMNKNGGSGCPAGCTQCDHPGSKTSYSSASSAAQVYAHAQLAALAAASQMPYVCNWIAGDSNYCGKRFATSEELFQHLRTQHTGSLSESMLNSAVAASAASAGLPPTHPLYQRTYPTPPLSPLSAGRYHPYSKPPVLPSSLGASSLAGLLPPHPSLAPYFSPYSLYGPRLGSPNMHP